MTRTRRPKAPTPRHHPTAVARQFPIALTKPLLSISAVVGAWINADWKYTSSPTVFGLLGMGSGTIAFPDASSDPPRNPISAPDSQMQPVHDGSS